jgi:hypothetical protein
MTIGERLGQNEALFRSINERIERGQWLGERDQLVAFRCECASLGCTALTEMRIADYERVRADPRRFLLQPGHEIVEVETVVERHAGYIVVEKVGDAGKVAEAADPRESSGG